MMVFGSVPFLFIAYAKFLFIIFHAPELLTHLPAWQCGVVVLLQLEVRLIILVDEHHTYDSYQPVDTTLDKGFIIIRAPSSPAGVKDETKCVHMSVPSNEKCMVRDISVYIHNSGAVKC